jgi:hypothetical protein
VSRPLRLDILGIPFEVIWNDNADHDESGDEASIEIGTQRVLMFSQTFGPDHERRVMLHEILHGIISLTAQEDRFTAKGEEQIVDSMSTVLLQVLRSNPHLVSYLVDR